MQRRFLQQKQLHYNSQIRARHRSLAIALRGLRKKPVVACNLMMMKHKPTEMICYTIVLHYITRYTFEI